MGAQKVKGMLFVCDVDGCKNNATFLDADGAKKGGWSLVETDKYKAWLCPSDGIAKKIVETAAPGF